MKLKALTMTQKLKIKGYKTQKKRIPPKQKSKENQGVYLHKSYKPMDIHTYCMYFVWHFQVQIGKFSASNIHPKFEEHSQDMQHNKQTVNVMYLDDSIFKHRKHWCHILMMRAQSQFNLQKKICCDDE